MALLLSQHLPSVPAMEQNSFDGLKPRTNTLHSLDVVREHYAPSPSLQACSARKKVQHRLKVTRNQPSRATTLVSAKTETGGKKNTSDWFDDASSKKKDNQSDTAKD